MEILPNRLPRILKILLGVLGALALIDAGLAFAQFILIQANIPARAVFRLVAQMAGGAFLLFLAFRPNR